MANRFLAMNGGGVRDSTVPIVNQVRRLDWGGGGAELIERAAVHRSEFRITSPRHAWTFSFYETAADHELVIDGRQAKAGRLDGSPAATLIPAGAAAVGWGRQASWRYLIAFFEPDFLARVVGDGWRGGIEIDFANGVGAPVTWHVAKAIRAECEADGASGKLFAESLGTALALRLLHDHSTLGAPRPSRPGALSGLRLRRVLEHLHDRVAEPVTLGDLAAIAGLSAAHLSHAFRLATGEAPHRYHLRLRIARAKALLADGTLPLAEIALACGFPSQSHFTTMFRRATGFTPGRWRLQANPSRR